MTSEEKAQKRVDEGNQQIKAEIRHCNEVNSYGPRRSAHWEVRGGQPCLVED